MHSPELLAAYPVLRTRDLDAARAAVSQRYCDHRLTLPQGRGLDVRHNHVRGTNLSLNLLGYGGDVAIDPGQLRDFYLLQLPLAGTARIQHRGYEVDASPARGTIISPDRPTRMEWRGDCVKLMVQIDRAFLNRVAEDDLGIPLPGPIRFDPAVDLTREAGRTLKTLTLAMARAIDAGSLSVERQSLRQMSVEHEIARMLLELQPSNISHLMDRTATRVAPRQLRRAIGFIHEAYAEELRLEDIAAAAEAHPRTLQIAFKDALGMTPMSYLRKVRLDMARYRLSARVVTESVTDVAFGCGYTHLGRFARDYRAQFGHSPSVRD
ncbi:AraC family transcriptional regulator [Pararhodobacter zhoushanensis]|uniref:AraC family transcriptional regulator n=1 Tax=Pararhodobacter zhoushanensis TaxID=2479545 RepID=UPI000F8F02D8|nr:AraC family transcriptional regulator [Pararhodobacter zhoushanensis]